VDLLFKINLVYNLILTASWYLVGIHIEDFAHIASEATSDGGLESSQRRTLVSDSGDVQEWFDNSTGVRDGEIKNQIHGRTTEIVELWLTYGRYYN
jgi:hypothetical protein